MADQKDPKDMHPGELQDFYAKRRADERAREAAHVAKRLKERAHRAFLAAGGRDEEFEEAYPALRRRMIEDEAVAALQADEPAVGSVTDDGMVRW